MCSICYSVHMTTTSSEHKELSQEEKDQLLIDILTMSIPKDKAADTKKQRKGWASPVLTSISASTNTSAQASTDAVGSMSNTSASISTTVIKERGTGSAGESDTHTPTHTSIGVDIYGDGKNGSDATSHGVGNTGGDSNALLLKMFEQLMQSQHTQTQALIQTLTHTHSRGHNITSSSTSEEQEEESKAGLGMSKSERDMLSEALKMKVSDSFSGDKEERITTFLSSIDKLRRMFGWADRVAIQVAGYRMKEKASVWFSSFVIEDVATSWDLFHDACISRWTRRISPHLAALYMGKFEPNVKQGERERTENYLARLRDELMQINSTEPFLETLCFLSGLRPAILEQVKLSIGDKAPPIEELLKEAVTYRGSNW